MTRCADKNDNVCYMKTKGLSSLKGCKQTKETMASMA